MVLATKMDKVCIVMSVYGKDCPSALSAALHSLRSQTYKNIQLCICKDGQLSTELESVIKNHMNEQFNTVVLSNSKNLGLAKSLNKIIDYIMSNVPSVKYLARMDSDDIAYPDRIEKQVNYMKVHGLDVCGSFCREFGASYSLNEKKVPVTHDNIVELAVTRCPFIHPTVVFDVNVFKSQVRYPENTVFTEDMALWFMIIEKGFKLGNVPLVLLDYRLNEDTVKRRLGFNKGVSELKLRLRFMVRNKTYSLASVLKILLRLPFHILPVPLVKLLYKYAR
ncbi:TPA: glycosyltransferase [Vibrio vulnificus]|nr:glycosyltransferase [Vibrio vulnificus]